MKTTSSLSSLGGCIWSIFLPQGPTPVVTTIGVTFGRAAKIWWRSGKNEKSFLIWSKN
jgi:hypothetical protein